MQSQQNFCSPDVRIHHRILDAQKHLPLKLDRQKKKFIENYMINVTIQQSVSIHLKHLFYRVNTFAETCSRSKSSVH